MNPRAPLKALAAGAALFAASLTVLPLHAATLVKNGQPAAVLALPAQPDEHKQLATGKEAKLENRRDLKPTFP